MTILRYSRLFRLVCIAFLSSGLGLIAIAQRAWNPCEIDLDDSAASRPAPDVAAWEWGDGHRTGLYPAAHNLMVYDANQGLCWLADADLAANAEVRAALGVAGIDPNGAMDYPTALLWVAALNAYNGGKGFLGHNDWQLPDTPMTDDSCADKGSGGGNFGPLCTSSAMGNLYTIGLNETFPDSVAPHSGANIFPFHHFQLSYYWATANNGGTGGGLGGGGQEMYAFSNSVQGGTTTLDSYYYVQPMVKGAIGTPPDCSVPGAPLVIPYTSGPGNDAVYDCNTGYTWLADADLARNRDFTITGDVTIQYPRPVSVASLTVPAIDHGSMLYSTANQWIQAMDTAQFLGSSSWQIPDDWAAFKGLVADMNLAPGDARLMQKGRFGPFFNLQPFFYWACLEPDPGTTQSPCVPDGYAPPDHGKPLQWSYNFDYGFQSTSALSQKYFVMVYYPAR